MWGKPEEKVNIGKTKEVLESFTACAQWYKEKKAAGFSGCGGVEDTPLNSLQELLWCVFGIHPAKVVTKVCKGVA